MNNINTKTNDQWQDYKFSDLCKITRGASPRPIHEWVTQSGGMPWVKISDATASKSRYLSKTKEQIKLDAVRMSVQVHPGDLIVSNSATPGIPKFLTIDACIHDGWLLLRDVKDTTTKEYLYYLLVSIREGLLQLGNGSIFTNLKTDILKNYPVKIPSKDVQSLIWKTLSLIDDKIDLLHAQNETFEKFAISRFLSLFNKNINNEEHHIGEYIAFDPKETIQRNKEYRFFDMKTLSENTMSMAEGTYRAVNSATSFRNFDTLLAKITPCLENGKTGFVTNLDDDEVARGSTEFVVMRSKGVVSPYWIYCLARSDSFRDEAIQSMTGTSGRQRVQISQIKNIKVSFTIDDMKNFHNECEVIFRKIKTNSAQINTLTRLRDKILPKLMTGEIELK